MFFFQASIFLISIILLSFSLIGHGTIITRNLKTNFCIDLFFGLIVITLTITIFHLFSKINFLFNIFLFLSGLILFFQSSTYMHYKNFKKIDLRNLIIILILVPMYISQKYHEDFGYYHLPYALTFLEEKIAFGFANINDSYVYNSIWLNLISVFFLKDKNYDFLTLPSFILFVFFIIFMVRNIYKDKISQISDYYLLVVLFYFLLKFTRISEFGIDTPAIIFSILGIYYFLKYFDSNEISEKKTIFFYNLAFSVFSILIKLSTAPIIILTIYLYFKNFKDIKFYIFNYRFLFIYFLLIVFFIQQFIYTGCLFFPTSLTCFDVSWFNEGNTTLQKKLELINKSYFIAKDTYLPDEYLKNFNWFPHWLDRNYVEISEHLLTMLVPTLIFIFFLKKNEKKKVKIYGKKFFSFFIFLSLSFWLYFSPVYRFGVYIFISLIFIFLVNFLVSKKFSKKIFIVFLSIFLFFNLSKNILRIYKAEDIFIGIQKIDNSYILRDDISNEYINIYYPDVENNTKNGWQGRLCWNIPFICSYNRIDVRKKNGYLIINKLSN